MTSPALMGPFHQTTAISSTTPQLFQLPIITHFVPAMAGSFPRWPRPTCRDFARSAGNPREAFTVKAADGTTDLCGVLYKPRNLDPRKKYPVIEITYPEYPAKYAPIAFNEIFYGSAVMNAYALAELGAIVVSMDGRGTSYRSAAFRNFVYGKDDVTATADHVAAIRHLA